MCVIVYIPAGENRHISKEELKADLEDCFLYNNDGAGFGTVFKSKVTYKKGYFKFKDLWADIKDLIFRVPLIVHFRIGTGSKINALNCHPFNSSSITNKCKTHANAKLWFMNGVLNCKKSDLKKSDTYHFIEDYSDILNNNTIDNNYLNMLADITGVKWAYLDKTGAYISDKEFIEDHGIYYSNMNHRSIYNFYYDYKEPVLKISNKIKRKLSKQTNQDLEDFQAWSCLGCTEHEKKNKLCPATGYYCLENYNAKEIKNILSEYFIY